MKTKNKPRKQFKKPKKQKEKIKVKANPWICKYFKTE